MVLLIPRLTQIRRSGPGSGKRRLRKVLHPKVASRLTSETTNCDLPDVKSIALGISSTGRAAYAKQARDNILLNHVRRIQCRSTRRMGQLLGEPKRGMHSESVVTDSEISKDDRQLFRLLSRGFDCLTDEEWRKSRRALVSLLRQRLNLLPETPPLPDGQIPCHIC